jgi:hypothetical protein
MPDTAIGPSAPGDPMSAQSVAVARDLFWQNVMREILTSLSIASASLSASKSKDTAEEAALFDGRLAILTRGGERVAIADVFPLFACGINTEGADRVLAVAVECSVFQVRTPDGQVFTLPLHEMRAFHALTPELMKSLEDTARQQAEDQQRQDAEAQQPFGFAAFTQLAADRAGTGQPSRPPEQTPPDA